eukprot:5400710-Prymnesium_polylepis.2
MLLFAWTDSVGVDEFRRAFLPAALAFLDDSSLVASPVEPEAREVFQRLQRRDDRRRQLRAADGVSDTRGGTKARPEKRFPSGGPT